MKDNFIQNIGIYNFKSFENLEIDKLSHFNLFIGANNIGKTSVLEALAFATGTSPKNLFDNFVWEHRKEFPQKVEDYKGYFHLMDTEEGINISINFGVNSFIFGTRYFNTDPINTEFTQITYYPKKQFINQQIIGNQKLQDGSQQKMLALDLAKASKEEQERVKKNLIGGKEFQNRYPNQEDAPEVIFEDKTPITIWYIVQRDIGDREKALLENLDVQEELTTFAQRIDPRIRTIHPDGNQLKIYYTGNSLPFSLNKMGTGFIKIIKLYLATLLEGIDVILFDEITDGLHPDTIQILLEFIIPELVKKDIQLFATSHSYDILEKIAKYEGSKKENISVHFLYRDNSAIKIHRYTQESVAKLNNFADLRRG